MQKIMAVLLLSGLLAACATATPYRPMDDGAGYGEQKLESNRYRVWFTGNTATPRETVENYVLYRAAELTLENGYDYFVLSDRSTSGEHQHHGGIGFSLGGFRFGSRSGFGIGIGTSTGPGGTRYQGQADVFAAKGRKPADNPAAFDAGEIKANLDPSIVRPPAD